MNDRKLKKKILILMQVSLIIFSLVVISRFPAGQRSFDEVRQEIYTRPVSPLTPPTETKRDG